ncbi:MAG: XRE family transcriptional regulator [Acidobacteriota bacterium]
MAVLDPKYREDLKIRIQRLIQDSGQSLPLFAARTNVSKNTLINYRDGATTPSADFLASVCREFSVDPRWLVLGEGEPYSKGSNTNDAGSAGTPKTAVDFGKECELVTFLQSPIMAGHDGKLIQSEPRDYYPFKRSLLEELFGKGGAFKDLLVIEVTDYSMSPTINHGDTALIDTSENQRNVVLPGHIYLVRQPEGPIVLKRLVLSWDKGNMKLACLSDNTYFPSFELALESGKTLLNYILAKVRWVGREFK